MKKNLLVLGLICTMLTLTNVTYCSASLLPATELSGSNIITPNFVYTYTKTITRYYSSFSDVPESIFYSEDIDGFGPCVGYLYLQSVTKVGSVYKAIYSGTLRSNNI